MEGKLLEGCFQAAKLGVDPTEEPHRMYMQNRPLEGHESGMFLYHCHIPLVKGHYMECSTPCTSKLMHASKWQNRFLQAYDRKWDISQCRQVMPGSTCLQNVRVERMWGGAWKVFDAQSTHKMIDIWKIVVTVAVPRKKICFHFSLVLIFTFIKREATLWSK